MVKISMSEFDSASGLLEKMFENEQKKQQKNRMEKVKKREKFFWAKKNEKIFFRMFQLCFSD